MDYSSYPQAQQEVDQQQQHNYEYQQSQSYNPYQYQIYDSSQPYYSYHQPPPQPQPPPEQQQQQYPYYPHDYYANPYAPLHYDSTQPPGVPLPPENGIVVHQTNSDPGLNSGFDPPSVTVPQPPEFSGNLPIGQTPYRGGTRGNGPLRGGGRVHFVRQVNGPGPSSSRGRGRGRGTLPKIPSATATATAPPQRPPPQPAFCVLCRVDCNSLDMLEKHINGKKHKHKLQKLNQPEPINNNTNVEQKNAQLPEKPDEGNQTPLVSELPVTNNDISNDTELEGANWEASAGEPERSRRQNSGEVAAGRGGKRKMRGGGQGRGRNKLTRGGDEPQVPKQANVPFSCDLCNVKCDTQAVLNTHLVGKKHQLSLKRLHSNNPSSHHYRQPPAPLGNNSDPQLVLAQILMAYVLSQGQVPSQTVSNQNALTEELRNQLQSLLGVSNGAVNEAPDHVVAPASAVVPEENSGMSKQVPGSGSDDALSSQH